MPRATLASGTWGTLRTRRWSTASMWMCRIGRDRDRRRGWLRVLSPRRLTTGVPGPYLCCAKLRPARGHKCRTGSPRVGRWKKGATLTRQAVERLLRLRQVREKSGIAGVSRAVAEMLALIAQAAPLDVNVLILGESGTGKELVAREIHRRSSRAKEVFIDRKSVV